MGLPGVEFASAGNAHHVRSFRALAGETDLKCAVRGGSRMRSARSVGRNHLVERRLLGTRRHLFEIHLALHRCGVDHGRQLGSLGKESPHARWMVRR